MSHRSFKVTGKNYTPTVALLLLSLIGIPLISMVSLPSGDLVFLFAGEYATEGGRRYQRPDISLHVVLETLSRNGSVGVGLERCSNKASRMASGT